MSGGERVIGRYPPEAWPEPKHTPGPWVYKATAGNHDFLIYPESTGRDVALVRDFNEANARLVAAAPELVEALTTVRELIEGYVDVEDGDEVTPHYPNKAMKAVRVIDAALAKAGAA